MFPLFRPGYKTVVRLFPHEAADLEPCLEAAEEEAKKEKQETWSTLTLGPRSRWCLEGTPRGLTCGWLVGDFWVKNLEMSNVSP